MNNIGICQSTFE